MILSNKPITKALIRLCGCAGWSAPLLFTTPEDMFSRNEAQFIFLILSKNIWTSSRENLTLLHMNNKGTDQPVRMQSDQHLCYFLTTKFNIKACFVQNFKIPDHLCSWVDWFESYLVGNHKDRFSRVKAHMLLVLKRAVSIKQFFKTFKTYAKII